MNRERWGTFSVADHKRPQAFVADVLLYDRLIIPVPPSTDDRAKWSEAGWAPERLDACVDILGDLAVTVPWDQPKREHFKTRYATAKSTAFDALNLAEARRSNTDPYYLTRLLLAKEFLPELPKGVTKVWSVAAYPSFVDYEQDVSAAMEERREKLAIVIKHRFLVPNDPKKSDEELLKQAVKTARRDDFKEKRAAFYRWQEDVIEQEIPDDKAIEEMEEHLKNYQEVWERAEANVYWKFAFTVVPVALSVAAATAVTPLLGLGGLVALYRFAKFDQKPAIQAGDCQAAAMLHDVQENFNWSR